ncbi:MAG: hypothetical protein AAFX99_14495 [Myxococcota bacterium]
MYTILAIVGLVLFAILALYFWDANNRNSKRAEDLTNDKDSLEGQNKDLKEELGQLKSKLQKSGGGGKSTKKKGDDSKKEIKTYKRQVHDLKEEVKALRKQVDERPGDASETPVASGDLLQIREELMEAKTEAANLRSQLEQVEKERDTLKADTGGEHVAASTPPAEGQEVDTAALKTSHQRELKDTIASFEEKIAKLKSGEKSAIRQVKDELLAEIKDLRSKVRRTQNDAEQQRRRADNNDKAYKITRLQLESALEKLALVDPDTHAPGGFYDPQIEAILKEEAQKKAKAEQQAREAAEREAEEKAQQAAAAEALAAAAAAVEADVPEIEAASEAEASKAEPAEAQAPEHTETEAETPQISAAPEAAPPVVEETAPPAAEEASAKAKPETTPEPAAEPEEIAKAEPTENEAAEVAAAPEAAPPVVEEASVEAKPEATSPEEQPVAASDKEPVAAAQGEDTAKGKGDGSGWTAIGLAAITEVTGAPKEKVGVDTAVTFNLDSTADSDESKGDDNKDDEEAGDALSGLDTSIFDSDWDLGDGIDSLLKSD